MDLSLSASSHHTVLARTIAALANSGGGRCIIEGEPKVGRTLLKTALQEILPSPDYSDTSGTPSPKSATAGTVIIVRPAKVAVREEEKRIIATVTPGDSLCTVGGTAVVYEDGAVRPITLTEVVRRAGSGG
ncbi:hypothetical protein [Methanogenium organophilum]|uniref:Uncharacterized protein n=1 Tax=Methanogenium organophilum TaxID=2199 RepID=A0A9X9S585_METOG|nr:hypothetical protein [Methanogenium organophilum]WAI01761.1 hypothetical protein OU421_02490 [Methanogenium organophilum]